MSKIAVETIFGQLPTYYHGSAPYTASALGLGPAMMQNNGGTELTQWAGPIPISVLRPFEFTTSTTTAYPFAFTWPSSSTDWIFLGDNAAAAATRKLMYATLNRQNGVFSIGGILTLTLPTATNYTVRGLSMTYNLITTGSISAAAGSNIVSGSNTQWATQGVCVGNRIGFVSGSTPAVPSNITQWYEITSSAAAFYTGSVNGQMLAIQQNGIILTSNLATTYPTGSSYVIEDLRAVMSTTNATATNGGVIVVKGLRPEIFNSTGTGVAAIPSAGAIDNLRASYWLADASTVTNTAGMGIDLDPSGSSFTTQYAWVPDTVANPLLFKYNIRAPLYLLGGAGKDTGSAWVLKTGQAGAPSGTPSQFNNCVIATMASGPGSGSSCLYYTTTTKVYRTVPMSTIATGSTSWTADAMSEIPPGTVNTFAASSLMNTIDYCPSADKLVIPVAVATTPFRSYFTTYNTVGSQMDRVWCIDNRQIDQTAADATITPTPSYLATNFTVSENNGIVYCASVGASAIQTHVDNVPLGADWEYG